MKICPNCGVELEDNCDVCFFCGYEFGESQNNNESSDNTFGSNADFVQSNDNYNADENLTLQNESDDNQEYGQVFLPPETKPELNEEKALVKENSKTTIIIAVLVIALLAVVGYLLVDKLVLKDDKEQKNTSSISASEKTDSSSSKADELSSVISSSEKDEKKSTTTSKDTSEKTTIKRDEKSEPETYVPTKEEQYQSFVEYTTASDTEYLNIRYGPSKGYDVKFKMDNDIVVTGDAAATDSDGDLWIHIEYNGKDGWAMNELLINNYLSTTTDNTNSINDEYLEICQLNNDAIDGFLGDFDGDGSDELVLDFGYNNRVEIYTYKNGSAELLREIDLTYGNVMPEINVIESTSGLKLLTIIAHGADWEQYYVEGAYCDISYYVSTVMGSNGGKEQNDEGRYLINWKIYEDGSEYDSDSGYTVYSLIDGSEMIPEDLQAQWGNLVSKYECPYAFGVNGGYDTWELESIDELIDALSY